MNKTLIAFILFGLISLGMTQGRFLSNEEDQFTEGVIVELGPIPTGGDIDAPIDIEVEAGNLPETEQEFPEEANVQTEENQVEYCEEEDLAHMGDAFDW